MWISLSRSAVLILLICCSCIGRTNAQFLTYETISTDDGLLSKEIYNIIQDSKGYVWMGTKAGLCRWDSKNFEYFTVENGLPNNEVLYLYEDTAGRIWISSFSEELCYYFNGRIYNRKNTPFLNKIKSRIGGQLTVKDNILYYCSVDGKIYKFNLSTQENELYNKNVMTIPGCIFVKHKGRVWAVQDQRNRNLLFNGSVSNLILNSDTFYNSLYSMSPDGNTDSITAMDFRKKQYSFRHGLDKPFYEGSYSKEGFQTALYNHGKVLEVYRDLILQKKDSYWIKVNYPNKDRPQLFMLKGNLYMPVTGGLLFCRQIPILEYEQNAQINNSAKFLFRYNGENYIVNDQYQLINVAKQKVVNQLKSNAINLYNLLSFNGSYYLATSFNIFNFTNPEVVEYYPKKGVDNYKYVASSKKQGRFFAANGAYWCILLIDLKNQRSDVLLVDKKKSVYSVYEDSRSRLWYSTNDKVYYTWDYYGGVKDSREFVLDPDRPLFCKSIQEDGKGNLFFTTNGGVFVYDGRNKYRIDRGNLLSDNECNKIVIDTVRNSFWVATKNGLNQIGYRAGGGRLQFRVLSKFFASDGLRSDNINDVLLDSNKLYIATDKGVNILDDTGYRPDSARIPVYIKLSAVNAAAAKVYDTANTLSLRHDQNNLTIGFSALYFLRRDRLKVKAYLYRNGSLVSRSEISGDKIDYYSLNDGDYKLVLYAFDQDYPYIYGRSEPFEFTITPPYYKTWWFITGSGLLIIIISTTLLLWNLNRRKKRAIQQAELQAKLNESTLKSLQSQMNPHFVFNSLNTIQSFITEKNEGGAIDYLSDFSTLMREILEQSVHTFISLENEIQFLRQYIRLEITRYKGSFDVSWDIGLDEDDLSDIYIPTMLIQPILENAVKHGVSGLNTERGHIRISFGLANDNLLKVVVKDNGRSLPHKKFKGNSIAVQTIRDRLQIYTKNKIRGEYLLEISEAGATATITIPI